MLTLLPIVGSIASIFGGDIERFDKVATEYLQLVGG